MADETREFKDARIDVDGAQTEPMSVTIVVTTEDGQKSGTGEATLPQDVFDKIADVEGEARVHTAHSQTFTIMIRKAYRDTRRVTFETSGPVPAAHS